MNNKSEIGKIGEDLACNYLINKSYKILQRNYRQKWGELDIIARSPDNILVFAEVKAIRQFGNQASNTHCRIIRQSHDKLKPEDNLTLAKLKKIIRTASLFAGKHPELIDEKRGWRIDLIAITIFDDENSSIEHYENIN